MNTSELYFNTPVIDNDGTVKQLSDFGGGGGDLPIATAETLGGVKIGSGISVTEDGTISTVGGFEPIQTVILQSNIHSHSFTGLTDGQYMAMVFNAQKIGFCSFLIANNKSTIYTGAGIGSSGFSVSTGWSTGPVVTISETGYENAKSVILLFKF